MGGRIRAAVEAMGVDGDAVGTVVVVKSWEDLKGWIASSPEVDFVIPRKLQGLADGGHEVREMGGDAVLLLGK